MAVGKSREKLLTEKGGSEEGSTFSKHGPIEGGARGHRWLEKRGIYKGLWYGGHTSRT